jgi:hypothetical protein
MGGRPFFAAILSILCGIVGFVGAFYYGLEGNYPISGGCIGLVVVCMGLWKQWRWCWWLGFLLLSTILYWNWVNREIVNEHQWFASITLWVYFALVYRDYN